MSITLTDPQSNAIAITPPVYPYTSTIIFPWQRVNKAGGRVDFWDNGSSYDKYVCTCTFLLKESDAETLLAFVSVDDASNARGDILTLDISGGGFFPFSPLRGDVGPFTIEILDAAQTGSFTSGPYKHYRITLIFANAGAFPSYTLPTEVDDGSFGIGTVTDMRFPPGGFTQEISYAVGAKHTAGNTVYKNDKTSSADVYNNKFNLTTNVSKMAATLNYLVNTGRTGDITLTGATDHFPFGRQKGGSGSFAARLLTSELEVLHNNFDNFSCQMGWQWRS